MAKPEKMIGVFLSGSVTEPKYAEPTVEFARLMVKRGYGLVWGGTVFGLMNTVCMTVRKEGGHLCGIGLESLEEKLMPDADEMIVAPDLLTRKGIFLEKSDAFAVLSGGVGTLDEATHVLELRKHGAHAKPIIFLNTGNFYGGLIILLERMEREGFLPKPVADLAFFADDPAAAIEYIDRVLGKKV